ncbi:site-specific integrase (plasmid) [Streptomyces sp. WC2508]|uniref:site-specific integrase n=1 Tax=Streptomyces sp. WC2508 TaxID=3461405 RepID=UPI0040449288
MLGVQNLPAAAARIGLRPGDPVFVAPDGTVDRDLLDFVRSLAFRDLERETKRNYATDIRPLLTFLSSRGVPWRQATRQDLADYRHWRCRAPQNSRRIKPQVRGVSHNTRELTESAARSPRRTRVRPRRSSCSI